MKDIVTTGAPVRRTASASGARRKAHAAPPAQMSAPSHITRRATPPLDPLAPDSEALAALIAAYPTLWLDLGTGDGRFVRRVAAQWPDALVIGVDACYANLRAELRRAPANVAFIVADALTPAPDLAATLAGKVTRVTINFPWGSLLRGLLPEDGRLLAQLVALTAPGALVEARLNGGALAEVGWELTAGVQTARRGLTASGFAMQAPTLLGVDELRDCPTTWARRLAFGRDPRAFLLRGVRG
ncbi:MAG TPA: class I SAM-dependent methyltransferase [Ktedonobacterales bacterium]|nr:class I SAM-dependent methyltransferase [Ktedonobacterales bacterium]